MRPRWGLLGVGAACAACCVPLVLPLLAGGGLAGAGVLGGGLLFGFTLDEILCVGLPLAALAFLLVASWRRNAQARAAARDCSSTCDVETCPPAPLRLTHR